WGGAGRRTPPRPVSNGAHASSSAIATDDVRPRTRVLIRPPQPGLAGCLGTDHNSASFVSVGPAANSAAAATFFAWGAREDRFRKTFVYGVGAAHHRGATPRRGRR